MQDADTFRSTHMVKLNNFMSNVTTMGNKKVRWSLSHGVVPIISGVITFENSILTKGVEVHISDSEGEWAIHSPTGYR